MLDNIDTSYKGYQVDLVINPKNEMIREVLENKKVFSIMN